MNPFLPLLAFILALLLLLTLWLGLTWALAFVVGPKDAGVGAVFVLLAVGFVVAWVTERKERL